VDKQLPRDSTDTSAFWRRNSQVDSDIGQAIKASPVWREAEALAESVPGDRCNVTALTLLASRPNWAPSVAISSRLSSASLPINRDSGLTRADDPSRRTTQCAACCTWRL
jgi:transposase